MSATPAPPPPAPNARKTDKGARPSPATAWRLPTDVLAPALLAAGLTVESFENGDAGLSPVDFEAFVASEDPVAFAYLYLTEPSDYSANGVTWCRRGDPWRLAPVQEEMTRLTGDVVLECAAEVGKTRDIVLHALMAADAGKSVLIATNLEITARAIFSMIDDQIRFAKDLGKRAIGGGLEGKPRRDYFLFRFNYGGSIDIRLTGVDGNQLRGAHVDLALGDECAKWASRRVFDEFFGRVKPGDGKRTGVFRLYSTPDGNYSSAFWGVCNRARAIDGRTFEERRAETEAMAGERGFKKFNIAKMQLPPPFWDEVRADAERKRYGGENAQGWVTNVLGRWGNPEFSVFTSHDLQPNLVREGDYRIVVVEVEPETRRYRLRAARLAGKEEELIAEEASPLISPAELARAVSRFFPSVADWLDPDLVFGVDIGEAKDPTEILCVRREPGRIWRDVFRANLQFCPSTAQKWIFLALDHASGHRALWGIDRGAQGGTIADGLSDDFPTCPICNADGFDETRVTAFAFGATVEDSNEETGELVLDTSKRNAAGEALPFRLAAKEFATRILEKKVGAAELRIAADGGAGDAKLGSVQLLVNHTAASGSGTSRRFKATDDHAIDARRLVALAIAKAARDGRSSGPPMDPALVASVRRSGVVSGLFRDEHDETREAGYTPAAVAVYTDEIESDLFGSGSVRGGFDDF